MHISLGEMEGRVDVAIYDMKGQNIDRFSFSATPKSLFDYNLGSQKSGIYLFVFNYNGNIITKKIVITK